MNRIRRTLATLVIAIHLFIAGAPLAAQTFEWTRLPGIPSGDGTIVGGGFGSFFGQSLPIGGIFRSTNGGVTWDAPVSGLKEEFAASFAIDGASMFIGSQRNILRSDDSGATWRSIYNHQEMGEARHLAVSGSTMIAFRYGAGKYNSWIIVSTDGGSSWSERATPENGVYGLAIDGSSFFLLGMSKLYRSDDAGATWTDMGVINGKLLIGTDAGLLVATKNGLIIRSIDYGDTWEQTGSFPYGAKRFSRSESSIILVGYEDLLESEDMGETWREVWHRPYLTSAARSGSSYLACVYNSSTSPKEIGVLRSIDNGATWKRSATPGINAKIDFLGAAGTTLFAQSIQPFFKSTDRGLTWTETDLSGTVVTRVVQAGDAIVLATDNGAWRSVDQGETWSPSSTGLPAAEPGPHLYDMIMHDGALYTTTGTMVYRSTDMGEQWELAAAGLPQDPTGEYKMLARHGSSLFLCSGTTLLRSTDNGSTWSQMGMPAGGGKIERLVTVDSMLVAVTKEGIHRSFDHGATWTVPENAGWMGGSGGAPIAALSLGSKIIVATSGGKVAVSSDHGATWAAEELPTYNFQPVILSLECINDDLYVGMRNTGLVRGKSSLLSVPRNNATTVSLECVPSPATGILTIRYTADAVRTMPLTVTITNILGAVVATIPDAPHEPGAHAIPFDTRTLPAGTYFCRVGGDVVPVVVKR